jgi:hypothetical protein
MENIDEVEKSESPMYATYKRRSCGYPELTAREFDKRAFRLAN